MSGQDELYLGQSIFFDEPIEPSEINFRVYNQFIEEILAESNQLLLSLWMMIKFRRFSST